LDGGDHAVAFLAALVDRGSSSYTVRTYGLGLEGFLQPYPLRWRIRIGGPL
jgi:hypothetical protein